VERVKIVVATGEARLARGIQEKIKRLVDVEKARVEECNARNCDKSDGLDRGEWRKAAAAASEQR
jgi:hypothetical protein